MRFSRRTIIAALESFRISQAEFTRFLLKLGPEFVRWVTPEPNSLTKRINSLIQLYDQDPERKVDGGELLADVIVETAVEQLGPASPSYPWNEPVPEPDNIAAFHRSLGADGFVLAEGHLMRALPVDAGVSEPADEISCLLDKFEFVTARGHLDQALDAHTRGNWAAANSQLRAFFEALLDAIAERLDPSAGALVSGQQRRAKLASAGFLVSGLNEWTDDGKGYINGLVRRLHPHGAHPGLSDEEDSTFRLQVVLATTRLLLARLSRRA